MTIFLWQFVESEQTLLKILMESLQENSDWKNKLNIKHTGIITYIDNEYFNLIFYLQTTDISMIFINYKFITLIGFDCEKATNIASSIILIFFWWRWQKLLKIITYIAPYNMSFGWFQIWHNPIWYENIQ